MRHVAIAFSLRARLALFARPLRRCHRPWLLEASWLSSLIEIARSLTLLSLCTRLVAVVWSLHHVLRWTTPHARMWPGLALGWSPWHEWWPALHRHCWRLEHCRLSICAVWSLLILLRRHNYRSLRHWHHRHRPRLGLRWRYEWSS